MHRRVFLKSMGVLAGSMTAAGALTACSGGDEDEPAALNVIYASFETLAGEARRFAFGLTTLENVPVRDAKATAVVRTMEGKTLGEATEAEFFSEGGSPLGLYVAFIDVPEPGNYEIEIQTAQGRGSKVISVIAAADSSVPPPGAPAIAVATPTLEKDLDVAKVCTNDPPCPLHEVSLDEALRAGRPVVLLFATPAYCTSALCAPAVNTLTQVRDARDWGDTVFIHVEIFKDEGQTVLQAVSDWGLRSEPWLFTINSKGAVVNRIDGPMIPSEITKLVEDLN